MNIPVYLEIGSKRIFASARDWPGWSRAGHDEASALQALVDYAPRYAAAVRSSRLGFQASGDASLFKVLERLDGDTTTDFGAPGRIPAGDAQPVDEDELKRLQKILKACWHTFDAIVESARGKTLQTGPRGGGRNLDKIVSHVLDAQGGYASKLGWKPAPKSGVEGGDQDSEEKLKAALAGLAAAAHGELPSHGPRGGLHWPPRYYVRRSAWHILDHAWEIEDRTA
jgi:hypothetical protein